jgi:hypothetical protein
LRPNTLLVASPHIQFQNEHFDSNIFWFSHALQSFLGMDEVEIFNPSGMTFFCAFSKLNMIFWACL